MIRLSDYDDQNNRLLIRTAQTLPNRVVSDGLILLGDSSDDPLAGGGALCNELVLGRALQPFEPGRESGPCRSWALTIL